MSKQTYLNRVETVASDPKRARILILINKVLTGIGYIAYPLLLAMLALVLPSMLMRCIIVPAASFLLVSLFRSLYNAKRPYELYDFEPVIDKNTRGRSFPSRHTFCMFMIACSWMIYNLWVGIALIILGCGMAAIRVVCGVHFVRDVVAGALIAVVFAAFGYLVIPWSMLGSTPWG